MIHLKELIQPIINTFLHNPNQFASGGLLLMAIGSVAAYLRNIPTRIWDWIIHQTTVTLSITDDQRAYYWVKLWFQNQRMAGRTRHLDVFNKGSEKYIIVPAPGHHWMFYKGRILSITIKREESKTLKGGYAASLRSESINFKTIGRKQDIFRNMMKDVFEQFVQKEKKKPELYAWGSWGEWQQVHAFQPRTLDSVILPEEDKKRVVREIESFKEGRDWYRTMGIPYRKGLLFYGPPGTGKTSLVTGLSSHFNSNVYILKLSDMTDANLVESAKNVEPNSFIIVEDIDDIKASNKRTNMNKDKKESKSVTLSGLLNVLDGLLSPVGAIFILTTNHKEALDPALIRPGRVDLQLNITYATDEQKRALYSRFFQDFCPRAYLDRKMTMAELQQELIERKHELPEPVKTKHTGFPKGD
jgi:mitochondrial chaperone BCS1